MVETAISTHTEPFHERIGIESLARERDRRFRPFHRLAIGPLDDRDDIVRTCAVCARKDLILHSPRHRIEQTSNPFGVLKESAKGLERHIECVDPVNRETHGKD